MTTDPIIEFFGEPIADYTREQALADGVLIDVTPWAQDTAFRVPVAFTAALWALMEGKDTATAADCVRGRADDVLTLTFVTVRQMIRRGETVTAFTAAIGKQVHRLWIAFHPAEGFTIGLPADF